MYHSLLIHSSVDGHLGCFHVLAMINSASMNIGVHVSLSDQNQANLKGSWKFPVSVMLKLTLGGHLRVKWNGFVWKEWNLHQ